MIGLRLLAGLQGLHFRSQTGAIDAVNFHQLIIYGSAARPQGGDG
jgi:hypothetical protein